MTFQTGDTVLYGAEGVCRITGIDTRKIGDTAATYYVLKPVNNPQATVFVPVKNEQLTAKMQRLLSPQEIRDFIHDMPADPDLSWEDSDARRREQFRLILSRGDRRELVGLIKAIYLRRQALESQGKKLRPADERVFKDAEAKLYDEFAHVLHIERAQVLPLILSELSPDDEPGDLPADADLQPDGEQPLVK